MNVSSLQQLIDKGAESFLAHLSVDCVIFGLEQDQLKVLILKITGHELWSLPGGHILQEESADTAALRVLKIRTGLEKLYLKQFKTFGAADRAFPEEMMLVMESLGGRWQPGSWLGQRFLSIGYYALVDIQRMKATGGDLAQEWAWVPLDSLPCMMMDHRQIIEEAYESLKRDLSSSPIGYNLLPEKFTMPELQRMYEAILGIALERSHFQKKMLRLNIYERLAERREGVAHKRPYLYRFRSEQYQEALEKGLKFDV